MIQWTPFPVPDEDETRTVDDESALAEVDDETRSTIASVFGADALELLGDDETVESDERALLASALSTSSISRTAPGAKHILFELNEQQYAVAIENVVEILHLPLIRRLPRLPRWLKGVFNRRGEAVSVVDVREYFGLPSAYGAEEQRLLVARTDLGELTVGLIVDQIVGIRHLSAGSQQAGSLPMNTQLDEFLAATVELKGQFVGVLDMDRLLNSPRMRQFEQAESATNGRHNAQATGT